MSSTRSSVSLCALVLVTLAYSSAIAAENQGHGLAFDRSTLPGGGQPFAIVATDLDGDKDVDLAVTNPINSTLSIYLGAGDGSFAPPSTVRTGLGARGVVAADFNRDARMDLATAATDANGMTVHTGLGDGKFAPGRLFPTGGRPFLATTADINRDEIPDIAVANEDAKVSVLIGDGRGGFSVSSYDTAKWPSSVATGDFNGDGHVDLAVTNWGANNVTILFGNDPAQGMRFSPPRPFSFEGHSLYSVQAADLNRDGHLDMIWNDIKRNELYLLYGDGTGEFPRTARLRAARGVRFSVPVDLNGDGWLDLATANTAENTVSVMLADGRGGFLPTQHITVGAHPRMVAAADVNGDQQPDLIATNIESNDITVLLNQGGAHNARTVQHAEAPDKTPTQPPSRFIARGALQAHDPSSAMPVSTPPVIAAPAALSSPEGRSLHLDWEYGFQSGSDANAPSAVAVDRDGSVYVAGDVSSGADWRVMRLSPEGRPLWTFDVATPDMELPGALALNAQGGELVIAGSTAGKGGWDLAVLSLSKDGLEEWRYAPTQPGNQRLNGVAADKNGNIYAVGESNGEWQVTSLTPDGKLRWTSSDGPGVAHAVAVDPHGDVFVAGTDRRAWRVVRLSPEGKRAWEHRVVTQRPIRAAGIALDPTGNAVVTGTWFDGRKHLRVEKLSPDGRSLWEHVDRTAIGAGTAVAIDPAGNAVIVGETDVDWLLLGLDPDGKLLWRFTHDGGGKPENRDQAFAVATRGVDSFVVSGLVHPRPARFPSLGLVDWRVAGYRILQGDAK